jgi:enamine deaminase RidA (YjgF/YER057c/UK114 family)
MKNLKTTIGVLSVLLISFAMLSPIQGCKQQEQEAVEKVKFEEIKPEFFMLRPEIEKSYGYSHAVKIGNVIKISGAVSMDDEGNPTAIGDMSQQMKNCYADLEKILDHYGCTFDDVVEENIFTTDMALFLENAGYWRAPSRMRQGCARLFITTDHTEYTD